ncbi:MAG TPA: triple tyrosine motif-containing protein, partial [Mariniflexile sp.]
GYFVFKDIPSQPNFIIGANYAGFTLFEKTKNGLQFKGRIGGFDKSSNFFEIDSTFLWLKRDRFLYRMKLANDYKSFTSVDTITQLLPSRHNINSLEKINGKVYFESSNHFYIYSKEEDRFTEDSRLSKLFSECPPITYLKEDAYGNLWYKSGESLGALLKDGDGNYKNLQMVFSNLTGNIVDNYLSINTIDPNNILIGTTNGLVHFDSKLLQSVGSKPKVFVRSFSYANDTIMYGNPQERQHEYAIPYATNNVKFTFSSPEYENPHNITFSYQLYPFDNKWSNWSSTWMKEYTNLSEGCYTMQVKVKNSYGMESDIQSLDFTISPPWYRHYLAYVSYFLIFVLTVYLISVFVKLRYRKREYYKTIEQRKIYLEKESKIRKEQYQLEKEIEKLNRDKLQTKLLSKDKELVNNSLQVAKKNKILKGIMQKLKKMEIDSGSEVAKLQLNSLKKSILKEIKADHSWKDLEKHIKNVHFEFLMRLKEKCPTISPRELDLATYLLINMSTKEIAEVMNISKKGVELARYRLRKKLGLKRKENLTGFLMNI